MATIRFRVHGKGENSSIYVRLSMGRGSEFIRKTGFIIDAKDWSRKKSFPIPKNEDLKNLKADLVEMSSKLEVLLNKATKNGHVIDGDWLEQQIDLINNKAAIENLDNIVNYTQHIIDTAAHRPNGKGGIGLSERRVKGYITFKGVLKRYIKEKRKGKELLVRDVDIKLAEDFKRWLFEKGYSINYTGKNIDNLKAVCNDAVRNGIEESSTLSSIKSFSENKEPEAIIYLSEEEQMQIASLSFENEALANAQKWLLLGCQLGQRGEDLLNIDEGKIKEIEDYRVVELKQKKTGKIVAIPLLPFAEEIIQDGFPYKIALQNFNEYIKKICCKAGIDAPTIGRKRPKSKDVKRKNRNVPSIQGTYPKHELIGSHVCRRSFATNYYQKIPTPILMNITGHGTERMFLKYIGKTAYDNAYQMAEYFKRIPSPTNKESKLTLVKSS